MTYQQQIKDPRWQKKRLEVLELNSFTCVNCGSDDKELHVHHPLYRRGAMIWEYEATELQSLCNECHKQEHALDEKIRKALSVCREKGRVLGYIEALNSNHYGGKTTLESYEECEGALDQSCGEPLWYGDEPAVEVLAKYAQHCKGKVDLAYFETRRSLYNSKEVA